MSDVLLSSLNVSLHQELPAAVEENLTYSVTIQLETNERLITFRYIPHHVPPRMWIADALSVSNCWATDKIIVIIDWDWKGTDPVILR